MEQKHRTFQNALSNFTYDLAARGAIRHLHDLGCDEESIRGQLAFPVSAAQIAGEIRAYEAEKAAAANGAPQYEFVRETDAYGRTSFRRVPIDHG